MSDFNPAIKFPSSGRAFVALIATAIIKLFAGLVLASQIVHDNHVIGVTFEVIGALYAIVIAFVMFVVWDQYSHVQMGISREAAALEDLGRVASLLPDANAGSQVRRACREYARLTTSQEAGCLAAGKPCPATEKAFNSVMTDVFKSATEAGDAGVVAMELLKAFENLNGARDERLSYSLTRIPSTLSDFMIAVAVILVFCILLLVFQQVLIGAALAGLLAWILTFLNQVIHDLDNPFTGSWNVSFAAMKDAESKL